MKIITQIIKYFMDNGMLSARDEKFLRDKGYINKFLSYDEVDYDKEEYYYYPDEDEEALQSELLLNEFEPAKFKKSSKKSTDCKAAKKQIKADDICKKLRDMLAGKLHWLLEFKTEAGSDDALKIIIYLNNLSNDLLKEHIEKIFRKQESVLSGFIFLIFEADYHEVIKDRSGIAVGAYRKAVSGLECQELGRYMWILKWDEVNLVFQLARLKLKVISLLSENIENNYITLMKKLKAGDGKSGILSVSVFLYMHWHLNNVINHKLKDLEMLFKLEKVQNLSQLLTKFPEEIRANAFYYSWLMFKNFNSIGFGEYLNMVNEHIID